MTRSIFIGSMAASLCLFVAVPLLAAAPTAVAEAPASVGRSGNPSMLAKQCLSDLRAFDTRMEKSGYWLGGAGYGFGYPMGEFGYEGGMGGFSGASESGPRYQDARSGYEVRLLVASANILARHGQQQACESVLDTTRAIYTRYAADMHSRGVPTANIPAWRERQIAAAQPVTGTNVPYRSDELLGTDVRNAHNEALGSVDDLVMNPQTGKIAYLVVSRGGLFGIGEKYVAVPWADFKITPNASLLVLDTTKAAMSAAPHRMDDNFAARSQFDQESLKIDAYWKAHLAALGDNDTKIGSKN